MVADMIPIVYPTNEKLFITNGYGRLSDCISCTVTEEKNGEYEATLEYPIKGHNAELIKPFACMLLKANEQDEEQPFDIYEINRTESSIIVKLRHMCYRSNGHVIVPTYSKRWPAKTLNSARCADVENLNYQKILINCPVHFACDESMTDGEFYTLTPMSMREFSLKMAEAFGCSIKFKRDKIYFGKEFGKSGAVVRYGKNVESINIETSTDDSYNVYFPYYESGDTVVTPTIVYGGGARLRPNLYMKIENVSSEFETAPTVQELNAWYKSHRNRVADTPQVNVKVNMVKADGSVTGQLNKVAVFDKVRLIHEPLGVDEDIEVVKTVYDTLAERYTAVELGNITKTLADVIAKR